MRDDDTVQDPGHMASVPGPGERLRQARERQELSPQQVAQQLNLETRQVRALEENDWAALPEPLYVVGYLRNYARLLGLPDDEIVAAYPRRQEESYAPPVAGSAARGAGPRRLLGLMAVVLAIAVMVLVIIWFLGRFEGATPPDPASETQPEPSTEMQEGGPPDAVSSDEAVLPAAAPVETDVALDRIADADASTEALIVDAEPAPPSARAEEVFADRPDTAPSPPEVPDSRSDGAPELATRELARMPSTPSTSSSREGGLVQLRLSYESDSWTEVTDAAGEQLIYGLIRAGAQFDVQGAPPLSLRLGYAPGVSIEYNGVPIDPAPYTRNDIARFQLGREARKPSPEAR